MLYSPRTFHTAQSNAIPIDVLSILGEKRLKLFSDKFRTHALRFTRFVQIQFNKLSEFPAFKYGGTQGGFHVLVVGMRSFFSFSVILLGVALAIPSPRSDHVVHETRAAEPIHWAKTGRLDSNSVLPMRFGLAQENLHRLEEMLMSVSHPESPKYSQHFTPMEVVDIFAPSKESISAVTNWLVDSGFSRDRLRLSPNRGWIHVNASASEVENLLNTEYHVYSHLSGDTQIGEE